MKPVYYVKNIDGSYSEAYGGDLESRFLSMRNSYQKIKDSNECMYRGLLDVQLMLMSGQPIADIDKRLSELLCVNDWRDLW